ncbi:phage Gp37/Gp68 family protein [Sphingomonas oryzagri]|uniref:Phage Gp37/Gp68 family protein n=1 Tax=Sphingomonas oryzagri TaxID=3042314 RepID=A0ABT6N5Z3_9SPHN|nr:phage Gp37/Gp68 family protein [Sphingomonas oryzagri]MDH7640539.1 phage Gp37/Gp68 family protein [Sphingomonas oryzagri]
MADRTRIEWTDATVNAINGCSVYSPGCKRCYAMKQAHRTPFRAALVDKTTGGMVWNGEVHLHEAALRQPLSWRRPRHIFWNAHGDTFHEKVPDAWIDRVFAACALSPQHVHQVLTKRSARMRAYISDADTPRRITDVLRQWGGTSAADANRRAKAWWAVEQWPLANVWLGVSAENQHWLMQRACDLVETPAAIRFLSCEPLLTELDIEPFVLPVSRWNSGWLNNYPRHYPKHRIDWVIVGGESGHGARPVHPDWVRGLRNQCSAAGVPFLFKQWGEHIAEPAPDAKWPDGMPVPADLEPVVFKRVGKKVAGRLLDGVQHDGMPA